MVGLPKIVSDKFARNQVNNVGNNNGPTSRQLTVPKDHQKLWIWAVNEPVSTSLFKVLLNPTSVSETKSSNWAKHYVPGQGDPILQWINGTERVVSFQLRLTKDQLENATINGEDAQQTDFVLREVASIVNEGSLEITSSIPNTEGEILNKLNLNKNEAASTEGSNEFSTYWPLSIQSYLDYYRSLELPRTSKRGTKLKAPPLVVLDFGSVLEPRQSIFQRTKWILANYSINITKFSPSLEPIDATINLTFIEYKPLSTRVDIETLMNIKRKQIKTYEERQLDKKLERVNKGMKEILGEPTPIVDGTGTENIG